MHQVNFKNGTLFLQAIKLTLKIGNLTKKESSISLLHQDKFPNLIQQEINFMPPSLFEKKSSTAENRLKIQEFKNNLKKFLAFKLEH